MDGHALGHGWMVRAGRARTGQVGEISCAPRRRKCRCGGSGGERRGDGGVDASEAVVDPRQAQFVERAQR